MLKEMDQGERLSKLTIQLKSLKSK